MLSPVEQDLVRAAVDLATAAQDGAAHTVAAALLTRSGRVITGMNTSHQFLGGSCAELTALANLAALNGASGTAAQPPDRPVTTVAVHGPTGAVVPPCGRCRQVLFDLDPDITSVVPGADGLRALPIRELLPHAYDWRTVKGDPDSLD